MMDNQARIANMLDMANFSKTVRCTSGASVDLVLRRNGTLNIGYSLFGKLHYRE